MMKDQGHLTDAEFEEYAKALNSNNLSTVPEALRRHVSDCLQCRKELAYLFRMNLNMEEMTAEGSPEAKGTTRDSHTDRKEPERSFGMVYRIAAGVALLVGCGALAWYIATRSNVGSSSSELGDNKVAVDSAHEAEKHRLALLAQNSTPSPNMEDLITSTFRGQSTETSMPHRGDTLRLPSTIALKYSARKPVTFRLLTNSEVERIRVRVESAHVTIPDTLTPGLYYWIVERDGAILDAGKVYLY